MIPRLPSTSHEPLQPPGLFERLVETGFAGDIETSRATRTVFSTDNSIYQLQPTGVLFPKTVEDLQIVARVTGEPEFAGITITPRGGGTGTNGQSLTFGLVVDCSRHMTRIIHIDPVRRVARVEAGVVKDQLNSALRPHGLFFAPELSTSNRATIGGMISTDASGQGSCLYGKTSNHVLGLRLVLADGTDWWSRPLDAEALAEVKGRTDQVGDVHRIVDHIARNRQDEIAAIFPRLNRSMTGYDLAHIIAEDGRFDLNAVICGSEGTLAMIAEAELNLLPIPNHAALINIRYDDFNAALEDARGLVALSVASVETIDEKVLSLAKGDMTWPAIARFFPEDASGDANGINIVEVLADDPDELARKVAAVTSVLDSAGRGFTIAREETDIAAIWSMRKRAVGLLGNVDGPVRPVAFVEDTAVPPENLALYIREFRDLLDRAGLSYGMFGHVDAGVLHVRPALDLTRSDHAPLVREISDAVVALTRKYGGVLWGEHGKGMRSEYVPQYFGPLYPCLQDIKRAFDPHNRLNPGKIAAPSETALTRIDAVPTRGEHDRIIAQDIRAAFDNAAYCNGNGACFDFDETSVMCPSFKATRDRRHSPKGRASLMREWLRQLAGQDIDPRKEAARLRQSNPIIGLPRRVFNSLNPANRDDFSHEVRAAMDTCLGCKACAGQCPVKVNVPAFRSRFFELYYGRYLRPLKHPLVAAMEWLLPLMSRLQPLYNLATTMPAGRLLMRMAGLTALPGLPADNLARQIAPVSAGIATPQRLQALSAVERTRTIVFVPDAFTTHFDPQPVVAAFELATKLGFTPYLAAPLTNGKALHVHGYLGRFAAKAARSARYLDRIAELGVTLVGIDPSMTLAFRSEYRDEPAARPMANVLLPQEWLCENLDRLRPVGHPGSPAFRLLAHCTERSNMPDAMQQWARIFERLGLRVTMPAIGCCGMAGTFGHETSNRPISERLYAMSWAAQIAGSRADEIVMATGYSCRSQVKQIDARTIPHPLQVINDLIG